MLQNGVAGGQVFLGLVLSATMAVIVIAAMQTLITVQEAQTADFVKSQDFSVYVGAVPWRREPCTNDVSAAGSRNFPGTNSCSVSSGMLLACWIEYSYIIAPKYD